MTADNIFSLKGKVALITGATGHLGKAMARALAANGAHVYVNGRTAQKVGELVDELRSDGLSAESAVFDVTSTESIAAFVGDVIADKPLDILVNNAYAGAGGNLLNSSETDYLNSYEIAVVSAQALISRCNKAMLKAVAIEGGASIINITSMYGMVSPDPRVYDSPESTNPPFYGAAKAALIQLTKYAASELAPEGIRVNCISPGPFPSDAVQREQPDFIAKLSKKVPLNRIGSPSELSGAIVFLASDAATYVTGSNLVVDGGWTIR